MVAQRVHRALATLLEQDTRPLSIVITQVDPDAMGGALSLQMLVQELRPAARIFYCGSISHPQNQTIVNLLDLGATFRPISEMPQEPADLEAQIFAFVDSSQVDDARLGKLRGKLKPRIVLDHHHGDFVGGEGDVVWIEHHVGAASTMLAELWKHHVNETGKNDSPYMPEHFLSIAKVLCLGIYTDTHQLIGATERDHSGWTWLRTFVSQDDLKPFTVYPLRETFFEHQARAWSARVRHESILVTNCGYIHPQDGDNLSSIADNLLRLAGITQVYVWGIIENKVRVSVRSEDVTLPLNVYLQQLFGTASGAKVSESGHGEGGALMLLDFPTWIIPETEAEVLALVKRFLEVKIFGGNAKKT